MKTIINSFVFIRYLRWIVKFPCLLELKIAGWQSPCRELCWFCLFNV